MLSIGVLLFDLYSLIGSEPPSRMAGRGIRVKSLSHDGDGAVEAMLAMTRCRCRVMLAIVLPSHAGDGATESC
jgi:hypothetical protein